MNKLAIRKRGGMSYEIGPTNDGPGRGSRTVMVSAKNKVEALVKGRPLWKNKYDTRATRTGS